MILDGAGVMTMRVRVPIQPVLPPSSQAMIAVGVIAVVAQVIFGQAMRYVRAASAGVITQLTPVTALA